MKLTRASLVPALASLVALAGAPLFLPAARLEAQNRKNFSIVNEETGRIALGLAIRRLGMAGVYMEAPAHPDDETNVLFAALGYGMGLRVIDLQNNRGEGGQNEIGPELFRDMGVLRTSELLAAHRIDGAEQYFTRAIDYGYSFSPDEVIQKWGRADIVGDYVRLFRTLRPDIVVSMNIQGGGGDRAHEATAVLVREAWTQSGDSTKYPEQLREGLRPWTPYKLYFRSGGGGRGGRGGAAGPSHVDRIDTSGYDPLLGRTYSEIASDARSNHKCQGVGGMPALPGIGGGRGGPGGGGRGPGGAGGGPTAPGTPYSLVETTINGAMEKPEGALFDGIDITLAGLARFAGATPPAALTSALATITDDAKKAAQAFAVNDDAGAAAPIEAGLTAVRALRASLGSMALADQARYEIDARLETKERDYEDAVIAAHGLSFNAIANDGLIIAGQAIGLSFSAVNRGATDVTVTNLAVQGFDAAGPCAAAPVARNAAFSCAVNATVPANAPATDPYFVDNYWKHPANAAHYEYAAAVPFGAPFAPTPFRAVFTIHAGSVDVTQDAPIQFRYVENLYFGDKRMELNVVPAFSVRVTPSLAIVPSGGTAAAPATRDVFVAVTNSTKGKADATVTLTVPAGWRVAPASVPLAFEKEDEALSAKFVVTAPPAAKTGEFVFKAAVTSAATGTQAFNTGYHTIEYPHVERRQVMEAANTAVKVIDVKIAPNLNIGYIMGVGDQVPPAIAQLGAKVTLIERDELAWGDLSKYSLIMTGVRAYERRDDLRAYNRRLLDYVYAGGTVVVNYNKTEFNQAQYGPYPASIGGLGSGRVNDETVPVKTLVPSHPIFNYPNKIGDSVWENWTQERGQYFLGRKGEQYVDLVTMTDSFPDNPGEQLGGLVEAKYGKGRWIYMGLGLWRQLPAGTVGAYQLMANILSLPKADK